jgi:hypothetical protein
MMSQIIPTLAFRRPPWTFSENELYYPLLRALGRFALLFFAQSILFRPCKVDPNDDKVNVRNYTLHEFRAICGAPFSNAVIGM